MTKPKPDTAEWWQQVAAGLGVTISDLKIEVAALQSRLAETERERDEALSVSSIDWKSRAKQAEADALRYREALEKEAARCLCSNGRTWHDGGFETESGWRQCLRCADMRAALVVPPGADRT